MLTNPRTTDLHDAVSPIDAAQILRNAADKYRESTMELQAAWQDKQAGAEWSKIARALETCANRCEKIASNLTQACTR